MRKLAAFTFLSFLFSTVVYAQAALLPPQPVPLDSLAEFRPTPGNWRIAGGIGGDPRVEEATLVPLPGMGILANVPTSEVRGDLSTTWEHGDIELEFEFLMPKSSNSGVFLQGRYEVQLYDGWGEKDLRIISGRIWSTASRPGLDEADRFKGSNPLANANRAPGLWQHMFIRFRAPRFDATGAKLENARFEQVILNGFLVQENVEVPSPTGRMRGEGPLGPLLIQGDHGTVAIRNLKVKRFGAERLRVENLTYEFFAGDTAQGTPDARGPVERFEAPLQPKQDTGVMVFTGQLVTPVAGRYGFWAPVNDPEGHDAVRLLIDDRAVFERSGEANEELRGTLELSAGVHELRLTANARNPREPVRAFLLAEGPGIRVQLLAAPNYKTYSPEAIRIPTQPIPVVPQDRVLVQRGFMPRESGVSHYALSVGMPDGMHYAYDPETAGLVHLWRGRFLDASGLWFLRGQYRGVGTYPPGLIDMKPDLWMLRMAESKGTGQQVFPSGPTLSLSSTPLLVQLGKANRWPNERDAAGGFRGYRSEANGQPVFRYEFAGFSMTDRIASEQEGKALKRTLQFSGAVPDDLWVVLAQDSVISTRLGGYIIGDRRYYIDWPADAVLQPQIRDAGQDKQLTVLVPKGARASDITYTLVW